MESTARYGRVVLRGRTDLMLNKRSDKLLDLLETKDKSLAEDESGLPREERARRRLHLDADGNPCLTADLIRETLKNAGRFVIYTSATKRNVTDGKGVTLLDSFFGLVQDRFPILDPETNQPASWVADLRPVPQKSGGGGTVVIRPSFSRWQVEILFWFDAKEVQAGKIERLFIEACKKIGFGSGRTLGKGRAEIILFEVEGDKESDSSEE